MNTLREKKRLSKNQVKKFTERILTYYKENGRNHLPWRKTKDPYKILVSEVMLQQTQVDRVIPKYESFLKKWPTPRALAVASLREVLTEWQSLGYNRRAKFLHECAKQIEEKHNGIFPTTVKDLKCLSGVGDYTAGALLAFAYNTKVPIVETNIRTVFIHHFFNNQAFVTESEVLSLVEQTLPEKDARIWYWSLMDYGAYLKKKVGNLNLKSLQYKKQSIFKGSDREIRGAIIKTLTQHKEIPKIELITQLRGFETRRLNAQIKKLVTEELLLDNNNRLSLP